MRIVFLGKNRSLLSIACLEALTEDGSHSVLVGVEVSPQRRILKAVVRAYRTRGLRFVMSRVLRRSRAKVRTVARKLGARPSGQTSLREMVESRGLQAFPCARVNSAETVERIRLATPDLIVVAVFGQILKADVIGIPRLGAINVHASMLPRYRGPNPFYWTLRNREGQTGLTVHYIDEGIDTGDIILQREMPVIPGDTETTLHHRSAEVARELLGEVVRRIADGTARRVPQDAAEASYFGSPPRERRASE